MVVPAEVAQSASLVQEVVARMSFNMNDRKALYAVAIVVATVGCQKAPVVDEAPTVAPIAKVTYTPSAEAGLPVAQGQDKGHLAKLFVSAAAKYGSARTDPFALTKEETAFETSQNAYRLFNQVGGFSMNYGQIDDPVETPAVLEPQPYRRLSGVVVGESVLAIIDMGEGSEAQIIHPGQQIPGTPWSVVSIDEDKAVLHRDGPVLPHDVTVRLESPPPGYGPALPTAPTRGFPGGGGFPGGPGGRFGAGGSRGGGGNGAGTGKD